MYIWDKGPLLHMQINTALYQVLHNYCILQLRNYVKLYIFKLIDCTSTIGIHVVLTHKVCWVEMSIANQANTLNEIKHFASFPIISYLLYKKKKNK